MGTGTGVLRGGGGSPPWESRGVGNPSKTMSEIRCPTWSLKPANWMQAGHQIRAKIDNKFNKWRL